MTDGTDKGPPILATLYTGSMASPVLAVTSDSPLHCHTAHPCSTNLGVPEERSEQGLVLALAGVHLEAVVIQQGQVQAPHVQAGVKAHLQSVHSPLEHVIRSLVLAGGPAPAAYWDPVPALRQPALRLDGGDVGAPVSRPCLQLCMFWGLGVGGWAETWTHKSSKVPWAHGHAGAALRSQAGVRLQPGCSVPVAE